MSDTAAVLAASMLSDTDRLKTIGQNMANAATPGYKARLVDGESFAMAFDRAASETGAALLDRRPAAVKVTGRNLDLAIDGPAYFQVETASGTAYTRRGDFRLDANGTLVTAGGHALLGAAGAIRLPAETATIHADGRVEFEGEILARIVLATFAEDARLQLGGDGLIRASHAPESTPASTRLLQGQLEASNVRPVAEMSQLIETVRHFSLSAQALRAYDQMLGAGIDGLGQF